MPYKSRSQEGYLHSHPEISGSAMKELDAATKGKNLPKKLGRKSEYRKVYEARKQSKDRT